SRSTTGENPSRIPCRRRRPATGPRAPLNNRNAPTPLTRLLPRSFQLQARRVANGRSTPAPALLLIAPPFPEGSRGPVGVLVLARPSAREDGRPLTKTRPSPSGESLRGKALGNP